MSAGERRVPATQILLGEAAARDQVPGAIAATACFVSIFRPRITCAGFAWNETHEG